MSRTVEHSYASSILRQMGAAIYQGDKRILDQLYPIRYPPLKTVIIKGKDYASPYLKDEVKVSTDYEYLHSLGWKITNNKSIEHSFQYQRMTYDLVHIQLRYTDLNEIPKGHHFEVNLKTKEIRLNGANASEESKNWQPIIAPTKVGKYTPSPFQINVLNNKADMLYYNRLPEMLRPARQLQSFEIKEVLYGITEDNEFCCFKKTMYPPRISISGKSGSGKTMGLNRLEGQMKSKWNYNFVNTHDISGDTQLRCTPWKQNSPFKLELDIYSELSLPLPYVYLYPTCKKLTDDEVKYNGEAGFRFSYPTKSFFCDEQLGKYNDKWEVKKAGYKWMLNLIQDEKGNLLPDGLLYCKTIDEIDNLIDTIIPEKMQETLGNSCRYLIRDIFNRGILETSSDVSSKWKVFIKGEQYELDPYNACLLCGLTPSLMVEHAREEDWFPLWENSIIKNIFKFSDSKEYKKHQGHDIVLSGDELAKTFRNKDTREIMDKIVSTGRKKYVGDLQATQYFSDVPESINANLTHWITYKPESTKDVDAIVKKWRLTKTQKNELKQLKKFECFVFGDVVLYDNRGNRREVQDGKIHIIHTLPPNAQNFGGHKAE